MQSVANIGVSSAAAIETTAKTGSKSLILRFGETIAGIIFSIIALAFIRSLNQNAAKAKK
jgi:hypothetical protein